MHSTLLPCFDPESYTLYPLDDRQCIAPTKQYSRCSFLVNSSDFDEADVLEREASNLQDGDERDAVLQRWVLARICGQVHREKVEYDSRCLRLVAERYGQFLRTSTLASMRRPQSPQRALRITSPSAPESPTWRNSSTGRLRGYHGLRPRQDGRAITNLSPSAPDSGPQIFVPYKSWDFINDILLDNASDRDARPGYVYAFIWPTHPEYIKIGYTRSPQLRLAQWQGCMPGARSLTSISVTFPERLEELVHLELASSRHQIIACRYCASRSGHIEWFKASAEKVTEVLNNWKKVMDRESLYTAAGMLSERWKKRIAYTSEGVTAARLLEFLDGEAEAQRAREQWEPILEIFSDFVAMLAIQELNALQAAMMPVITGVLSMTPEGSGKVSDPVAVTIG